MKTALVASAARSAGSMRSDPRAGIVTCALVRTGTEIEPTVERFELAREDL